MNKQKLATIIVLSALLAACAMPLPMLDYVDGKHQPERMEVEVTAQKGDSKQRFLAVLEFDANHTGIAAITPTGLSLFSASLHTLAEKSEVTTSLLNTDITDPDFVIPALLVTLGSPEKLKTLLPKNWQLIVADRKRQLNYEDKPMLTVDYTSKYPVIAEVSRLNDDKIIQSLMIRPLAN